MKDYRIVIIGAGKIAYSIVSALVKNHFEVKSVISKNISSAKKLANKFSVSHHSDSVRKIPGDVNVFLLTVPDGQIKTVAKEISKLKIDFKRSIFVHFSGICDISELKPIEKKGGAVASFHLMQTFPERDPVDLKGIPASLETKNKKAERFLTELGNKLKLKVFKIKSEEKPFYHLAGVFGSNFLVGNLFNASEIFTSRELNTKEIFKPTTEKTIKNIFADSPANALSGPVDRGDIFAIKKHISALNDAINKSGKKELLKLLKLNYLVQSLSLLDVVEKKYGKHNKDHLEIRKLLQKEIKKR